MLLDRAAPGDRDRAVALLDDAEATARALGMVRLGQAVTTLRGRVAAHDAGPAPAGLSRREAEVLALIGAGLDNETTAARLTLSVRTVERHVENIYAKLGLHGRAARAAAAAAAHRLGLVSPPSR